jgi:hypothetical protein
VRDAADRVEGDFSSATAATAAAVSAAARQRFLAGHVSAKGDVRGKQFAVTFATSHVLTCKSKNPKSQKM